MGHTVIDGAAAPEPGLAQWSRLEVMGTSSFTAPANMQNGEAAP